MSRRQTPLQNKLLAALPDADLSLVLPKLEAVSLELRQQLEAPNKPIQYVYFIESGIGSVVANGPRRNDAEVALFGREGMSGTAVTAGDTQSPFETFFQVKGLAFRIGVEDFRSTLKQSPTLKRLCTAYVRAQNIQTSYTALVNAQSKLEERLARWLLMIHDRIDGEGFETTHEFIADMLAVRRPGVTVALHLLEGKGLIRSNRGEVLIRDRQGLIELAGASYGVPEREYERIMGFSAGNREIAKVDRVPEGVSNGSC
jgi:CRP-like cAMP-binding protein